MGSSFAVYSVISRKIVLKFSLTSCKMCIRDSLIAAYLNNFDIYNFQSGGKVKSMGVKKFKRDETNPAKIVEAFLSRNFEYLADLPGGRSEPVQLHIEEDATGREMYCLLTTYDSDSNIVGLADVITLSGNDYDDNIDLIKQMFKDEEDN